MDVENDLAESYKSGRDVRMIRAKLMVSELAEVLQALVTRDEVELADGLADLEYVVVGTATTFDVPLGDVFDEVHRSNMTKSTVESSVRNHDGDRGKGPQYSPPDVAGTIARSRSCLRPAPLQDGGLSEVLVTRFRDEAEPETVWKLPSDLGPRGSHQLLVTEGLNGVSVDRIKSK